MKQVKFIMTITLFISIFSIVSFAERFVGQLSKSGFIINNSTGYQLETSTQTYQLKIDEFAYDATVLEAIERLMNVEEVFIEGEATFLEGTPWHGGLKNIPAIIVTDIGQVYKTN